MLKAILLREILDAFVSRKFLFICLLCCTLIPLSVLVNQRAARQFAAYQSQAESEFERSMRGFIPSDQLELKVFRKKAALAGMATGLDMAMPSTIGIRQDGVNYGAGQILDNPISGLFGKIDLLFIVKFVLSLVAIILSFNMICGEKERGTLRLILSNPVPRDSLLFGKYLSAMAVLMVPFAIGLLISLLALQFQGDRALASGEQWLRIATLFGVSVLYLSCFLSLGALVSSWTSRSLTAITVLLFLWAGLIAVVPQVGGILAEAIYPVESTESFMLRKNLAAQDIERRRNAELRPHFQDPDYEEIRKPVAMKYALEIERIHGQMDREYANRRRTQFRIASLIASLSPTSPLTMVFTALSGTGLMQAEHFQRQLGNFREQLHREIFSQGYRDLVPGVGGALMIGTVELENVPRFTQQNLNLAQAAGSVWDQMLLLVGFTIAFFLLAYIRFRRYDVR